MSQPLLCMKERKGLSEPTSILGMYIIISALACYFLCDLDQQKIAAVEDTVDKQR